MKVTNQNDKAHILFKQGLDNERNKKALEEERARQNLAHQKILQKEAQGYERAMKQMDRVNNEKLQIKKGVFLKAYADAAREQLETLEEMRKTGREELKNLASKYSAEKERLTERSHDSFYSLSTLSPYIEKIGGEYLIYLDIPEYEKENVTMTVEGRKLRINMSRRFSETVLNENTKSVNQSTKRSELITQEMHVDDLLDPKTLTKQYEEGQLIFRVLIA